ncbi:helix-turn-helix domain-containing protein [Paraburkholderia fungorum]|uniref:helix-turn-helix domain-containing protein n=1 Tax=Paraburkholderia fungorum TaxID=134537 RepID=UPI0038B97768
MKPTQYIHHLRIEKAQELLQFTRRPIEWGARSVGYKDHNALRHVFRRFIGMSLGHCRGLASGDEAASNEADQLKSR